MKPSVDFSAALGHAAKYDVQIIRDEWNIPHILGKTDADTAHGLAYAHAEDDFATIQDVFLAVRGKLASELGLAMAPNDYYVHLIRLWDGLDEKYATLDPKFRAICQGYCDGLNLYASRHPEKLKRNIWPAKPQDLVAGSIHKLPMMFGLHNALARLMADTEKPLPVASVLNPDRLPLGSNFVAVGPSRSTDEATRVCINSHQPWTGPVAWYEAHLISEEGQNIYGGLFPGSPVIFLGHNENIAWGHTVNQPDLVDTFELELNPENENQYKIDGEWLELERRLAPLEVRLWRDFRWTVNREVLYSIFGPAMRVNGRVFAVRYAGIGEFRQTEQWYRMGRAQSLEQFKDAMRIQALAMNEATSRESEETTEFIESVVGEEEEAVQVGEEAEEETADAVVESSSSSAAEDSSERALDVFASLTESELADMETALNESENWSTREEPAAAIRSTPEMDADDADLYKQLEDTKLALLASEQALQETKAELEEIEAEIIVSQATADKALAEMKEGWSTEVRSLEAMCSHQHRQRSLRLLA